VKDFANEQSAVLVIPSEVLHSRSECNTKSKDRTAADSKKELLRRSHDAAWAVRENSLQHLW
jgi:hypothetical protein